MKRKNRTVLNGTTVHIQHTVHTSCNVQCTVYHVLYIMSWLSRGVGRYAWPPHSADGFVHSPPVSMPPGARGAPAGPNWCRWGGRSGDFSHVFCTSIMAEACFGTSPIRIVWDFFLLMFKYGKYLPFQKVKKTWHSAMKNPLNILITRGTRVFRQYITVQNIEIVHYSTKYYV